MKRLSALLVLLGCTGLSCNSRAEEPKREVQKPPPQALSMEMLLFLADMEEVEGELVHPVDLVPEQPENEPNSDNIKTVSKQSLLKQDVQTKGKNDEQN